MNIAEIRQRFPQYRDMSDAQLGDALHARFYADMPKDQFLAQIGVREQPAEPKPDPTKGMNALQLFLAGSGKAVADLGRGAGQMVGLVDQKTIDEARALDAPLMNTTAGKIGNIVGNIGATLPTMAIPGANTLAGSAAIGGVLGAMQPTADGESRVGNALMGGAGGLAGQGIANAVGRLVRPVQAPPLNAEMQRLADLAKQKGIQLRPGQLTQSKPLLAIESVMEDMPFTAGRAAAQRQSQTGALNRALLETMGEKGDALTPDVLNAARTRIGGQFSALAQRNNLNVTMPFLQRVSGLQAEVAEKETSDVAKIVNSYVDDLFGHMQQNGTVGGEFYRRLDSKIGKQMRGTSNGDLRNRLGELQGVIRQAMDDSISPADQAAWQTARREYRNLKTIGAAVTNDGSGDTFPGRLAQAARRNNENAFLYGRGDTEVADLAKVANAFVRDSVPNSGTAQRQFWRDFLGGSLLTQGLKIGQGVAGATVGVPLQAFMSSPAGQMYLTQGLLSQGNPLMRTAPYGAALLRGSIPAGLLSTDGAQ